MPRPRKRLPTKQDILNKYELSDFDKQVIEYKIKFAKITHEEIAALLDTSRSVVTTCLLKIPVREALADFQKKWFDIIIGARQRAARRLRGFLDSKDHGIAIRAAEQILQLDRMDLGSGEDERTNY